MRKYRAQNTLRPTHRCGGEGLHEDGKALAEWRPRDSDVVGALPAGVARRDVLDQVRSTSLRYPTRRSVGRGSEPAVISRRSGGWKPAPRTSPPCAWNPPWAERYEPPGGTSRLDHILTGGSWPSSWRGTAASKMGRLLTDQPPAGRERVNCRRTGSAASFARQRPEVRGTASGRWRHRESQNRPQLTGPDLPGGPPCYPRARDRRTLWACPAAMVRTAWPRLRCRTFARWDLQRGVRAERGSQLASRTSRPSSSTRGVARRSRQVQQDRSGSWDVAYQSLPAQLGARKYCMLCNSYPCSWPSPRAEMRCPDGSD